MKISCNVAKLKEMATINLVLDTRRIKMDGTYPLVFRIRHEKKFKDIASGYTIQQSRFNQKTSRIIKDSIKNEQLDALLNHYYTRMKRYMVDNIDNIELQAMKNFMLNKLPEEVTLKELWQEEIDKLIAVGKLGNARAHVTALSVIDKIISLDLKISKFTYKDLLHIETTLLMRSVKTNSIGAYMRSLRTICNKAINLDYAPLSWYPFRKYKIKKEKTTPRVMTIGEVKAYFALNLDEKHVHFKAWNIGKLIFMLRGINLKDLLTLTTSNLVENRIIYKRSKTAKMYSIKLTDEIKEVLDTFTPNVTLLGLHSENDLTSSNRIQLQNQRHRVINNHLKKIGSLLSVKEPITSYVFRYSYANIAKQLGFNKDLIAEALGHQYGNQITTIYLELFDIELVDEMNRQVIKEVT